MKSYKAFTMKSLSPRLLSFLCAVLLLGGTGLTHAQTFVYNASLSGPAEDPPNASPGTGFSTLTINLTLHTFRIVVNFSGLTGTVSAAHIHAATAMPFAGTAGVATQTPTLTGFPSGTSGMYDMTFDMTQASTWNSAFITANGGTPAGAEAAFAQAVSQNRAYLNIHSSTFGGGEIRGFYAVPEPSTFGLLALAGAGLLAPLARRRFRKS